MPLPAAAHGIRTLEAVEREHILSALEKVGGNRSEAARLLGIGRNTLARKLRGYQ
ncbi:MAG: helix-turn-helix domain-containing protein [Myxococcales bacterium]